MISANGRRTTGLIRLALCILAFAALCSAETARAAAPPAKPKRLLLAHYMPWYETDPVKKTWGWHWTMNHFHPEKQTGGRREIASHLYPLIGTYDSNDDDALECHVLLMKLSGIDGVIIDWYGIDDLYDYANIHRNTQHLIRYVKKAGLRYAIMYEDQTVPNLLSSHKLSGDVVAHGERVVGWMQTNWFGDPSYVRQNGRPVLMVFGNGYYTGDQWSAIFSKLPAPAPELITENYRRPPADGGFVWPYPAKGTDAALQGVTDFYSRAKEWPDFVAGAFPRFDDIYADAGIHASWGKIDDRDGKTYSDTLEQALRSNAEIVQLITWNDWGEGTVIEPTIEHGYRDLETTQRLGHKYSSASTTFTAADLRLPVTLYQLRKRYAGDAKQTPALDDVSRLLFAGRTREARALLEKRFAAPTRSSSRTTRRANAVRG